jgi:1,4-dihydroxy-2-naphthoate octaprenyltransferase
MDRDDTPIGGLAHPLLPTRQLFLASVVMDILAIIISFFIDPFFAVGILLYIIASRAYSYRKIRLKQYPIIGFLIVFLFQGAVIFYITCSAVAVRGYTDIPLQYAFIASLLIGALYPLTQVYQHEADKKDGVTTISYLLGKRGSFILSMLLFLCATIFIYLRFQNELNFFYLFLLITCPVVLFFLWWMRKVWLDERAANFKNSLYMNIIATLCTTVYFFTLIVLKH